MTGTLLLVKMNESDPPDCCKLGLNVPPHCTVKELYPLISSTVLALVDTDTLNIGTTGIKSVLGEFCEKEHFTCNINES